MLPILVIVIAAFLLGVLLTMLPAIYVIGIMHAEAVRIVDGYNGMALFPPRPPAKDLRLVTHNG